jgi:4-carboxymuconolactone decarboxylase
MDLEGIFRSVRVNRRRFLKRFSEKALAVIPLIGLVRWVKQTPITGAEKMSKEPSGAQKMFGDFAPKLSQLTDDVLFSDVWERKELSKRDRSIVTVAALVAMNRPDQLRHHLQRAVENGVKKEELIEAITHLAFYAGWPSAVTAIMTAKEVFWKA